MIATLYAYETGDMHGFGVTHDVHGEAFAAAATEHLGDAHKLEPNPDIAVPGADHYIVQPTLPAARVLELSEFCAGAVASLGGYGRVMFRRGGEPGLPSPDDPVLVQFDNDVRPVNDSGRTRQIRVPLVHVVDVAIDR